MIVKVLITILLTTSCSTVYYKSWEFLGQEKRDLLKSKISDLNEDQAEAKEEFKSVLDKIRKEYDFKEDELESTYDQVSSDYDELNEEVEDVSTQLAKVKSIAADLFEEWEDEASTFKNNKYKKQSLNKLYQSRKKFNQVAKTTEAVEQKMQKTLSRYREQVLILKHNLNAKMIGQLKVELKSLQSEMSNIITNIEKSIGESESFLKTLN